MRASEARAERDEHDIIKLPTEGVTELAHKELHLPWVGWPHDERVEGNIAGVHFNENLHFIESLHL